MARRKKKSTPFGFLVALAVVFFGGFYLLQSNDPPPEALAAPALPSATVEAAEGDLIVHFLDVGKADSILLLCGGESMLIDAGRQDNAPRVLQALEAAGIDRLTYAVATHPHEDHIGGMPEALAAVPAENTLLSPKDHTTRAYENLLEALETDGGEVAIPEPGDTFALGGADITVLAPLQEDYNELNDGSIVLRVEFGSQVLLFTGDAQAVSEDDMIETYGDALDCDLLKVGHHGSDTSSKDDFLDAARPEVAVISCGPGEEGPSEKVMRRLEERDIPIYTTQEGEVVAVCDGERITFGE